MDPECPFARTDHDRLTELEHRISTHGVLLFIALMGVVWGVCFLVARGGLSVLEGAHG